MFYTDPGPFHFNHRYCGQTVNWSGSDSQENFIANTKNPKRMQRLIDLGWLDKDCLTYQYNAQGFRSPELDDRPAGLALGCSHTEGVGVPVHDTWPAQLSLLLGMHVWNFGVGGSSKDTAFRLLDHYIDLLNLKFVVLCGPSRYRLEIACDASKFLTVTTNTQIPSYKPWLQQWFLYDKNSDINTQKNLLAMQHICQLRNIPFFYIDIDSDSSGLCFDGLARDLTHPGKTSQKQFAEKIYNMIKCVDLSRL